MSKPLADEPSLASSTGSAKKEESTNQASITETLKFVFDCGSHIKGLFFLGCLGGVLNGMVYPALAYLFSNSFSDITGAASNGLGPLRELAFTFMGVGTYALIAATVQSWSFEYLAFYASNNFRKQWFEALLRQDTAYFDIHDAGGIANQIGPSATKYRRGIGRKFGEGIQFLTTGIGGLAYAFYSSWKVAFVVLGVVPFVSFSALMVLQLNQTKGARAAAAYKQASSVAYSSVSSIKTVLSLNAVRRMISIYSDATEEAFHQATKVLVKQGFANGSMLGTFMLLYCILTLFGSFLLYREVRSDGCDPSDSNPDNFSCGTSGAGVFGAMLGVAFAAQGVSQFGNFSEAFTAARVVAAEALKTINRRKGAPSETIYRKLDDDDIGTTVHSKRSKKSKEDEEEKIVRAILPTYEIDSSSETGVQLKDVEGRLSFNEVSFSYPTRPTETVLDNITLDIEPGKTVAFVGPSGSGKSTVVGMVERFYDPQSGRIELDGVDLRDINVSSLRKIIGYVGQEPALFACSIRDNIKYGNPNATNEQIEEAAKLANAHEFILGFSDGYDTQVGDKGSQLSGGQKQRIAIARVLIGEPRVLILDEATSALDVESELVVQEALDNILQHKKTTTIIIAHRLSTIRNCDVINVLVNGQIKEQGPHDELMGMDGYYKKLVDKQEGGNKSGTDSGAPSRSTSTADLTGMVQVENQDGTNEMPHLSFKNCYFSYPSRPQRKIFNGFNLDIQRGSTVALVGPSGGGKSTTVGIIERFYDVDEGVVEYNGVDLTKLNVQWYREKIGYVGQEPTLFNETIATNISWGCPGASRDEITLAAKQANAHDFIMSFPEGYETQVGERGTQISGGQKQRIAIARALVKHPEILILDEATSALDNESEAIVQAAIDKLMESRQQTCIVIAHRLSTIRGADKIVVVADGVVAEYGTHDELIAKPHGRYKRLFDSSKRDARANTPVLGTKDASGVVAITKDEENEINWEDKIEEEAAQKLDTSRALKMAVPDIPYILLGAVGAVAVGSIFPLWGLLFSETIDILFRIIEFCDEDGPIPLGFATCEEYFDDQADVMRQKSFRTAGYWFLVFAICIIGNIFNFVGFGTASERLNKRVRDSSFAALLRQEVGFFDKQSVGKITSQLQDDAARIHAFSGEPVRALLVACASVVTGIVLSFIYMWQFAMLALACIPLMGFATSLEMQKMLGSDEGTDDDEGAVKNSPGGIIVETLLNMRTVSALSLERQRLADYAVAVDENEPNVLFDTFLSGVTGGVSMFVQQWINALQLWFGGWLLNRFPERYEFKDFLIANFTILFGLFGLGGAFQDISDRKEVEKSAGRIFLLLDRESKIDPLSEAGLILDGKEIAEVQETSAVQLMPSASDELFV